MEPAGRSSHEATSFSQYPVGMAKQAKGSDTNLFRSSFLPANRANTYPGPPPGRPAVPVGPLEASRSPPGTLQLGGLRNIKAAAKDPKITRGRGRRARYVGALCQVLGTTGRRGHKAVMLYLGRMVGTLCPVPSEHLRAAKNVRARTRAARGRPRYRSGCQSDIQRKREVAT